MDKEMFSRDISYISTACGKVESVMDIMLAIRKPSEDMITRMHKVLSDSVNDISHSISRMIDNAYGAFDFTQQGYAQEEPKDDEVPEKIPY